MEPTTKGPSCGNEENPFPVICYLTEHARVPVTNLENSRMAADVHGLLSNTELPYGWESAVTSDGRVFFIK